MSQLGRIWFLMCRLAVVIDNSYIAYLERPTQKMYKKAREKGLETSGYKMQHLIDDLLKIKTLRNQ